MGGLRHLLTPIDHINPTTPHHTKTTTAKNAGIKPRTLSKAQLIEALESAVTPVAAPQPAAPTASAPSRPLAARTPTEKNGNDYIRPQQRRQRGARDPLNPGTVRRRKGLPRLHTLVTADLRENFGARICSGMYVVYLYYIIRVCM